MEARPVVNSKAPKTRPVVRLAGMHVYVYVYVYIYIAVELLSGPSLAFLMVINWAKFVFFYTVCQKHYTIGVSADLFLKRTSKLAFVFGHQLGPVSNH